jgi:addiction module RelE/StbE family toxin
MKVRWTRRAIRDLTRITQYIQRDSPAAADWVFIKIYETCGNLSEFPNIGHRGRRPNTLELVLSPLPYVVVYRIKGEVIEIVRVWHGAQNR